MLHEISESEFHALFRQPISSMRFCLEELGKAYEARLDTITHNIFESNGNETILKSSKSESNKAVEGLRIHCNYMCDAIKKSLEKSYEKIENNTEERTYT